MNRMLRQAVPGWEWRIPIPALIPEIGAEETPSTPPRMREMSVRVVGQGIDATAVRFSYLRWTTPVVWLSIGHRWTQDDLLSIGRSEISKVVRQ